MRSVNNRDSMGNCIHVFAQESKDPMVLKCLWCGLEWRKGTKLHEDNKYGHVD